jgi:hypothetical protein
MFGLSKLADKNFVIGFLLPVLIVSVAAAGLFRDTATIGFIYAAILKENSFTGLTVVVLAIWSAATLLMVWNHAIYQALEGYIGPFKRESWREQRRTQFMRERDELRRMRRDEPDYVPRIINFRRTYPHDPNLILPTRFGNVIRAFETYSLNVYGVDAIPAWHRLVAVVPKDFAGQVDDARAEVNFWINVWVVAILFTGLAAARFIWDAYSLVTGAGARPLSSHAFVQIHWEHAVLAAIAIGIAFLAYGFAIERAQEWGDLVKSAFDLYLPALAKVLGYDLPPTREGQLAFWDAVNGMFLLQTPLVPECWQRARDAAVGSDTTEPPDKREKAEENNGEAKDGIEEVEDADADED